MNLPLRVQDYMTREVITVPPEMEIMQLVNLLVEQAISGVVVVDAEQRVVGIVTERDCIHVATHAGYFDQPGGRVGEFMSAPVEVVGPDDNLMDVATHMVDSPYRRFPVVAHGRLVGLLSRRDVLGALRTGSWFSTKEPIR